MDTEELEPGAQRLLMTDQISFKLIWARSTMFVPWQHKDISKEATGPKAINYNFHYRQLHGKHTAKTVLKR